RHWLGTGRLELRAGWMGRDVGHRLRDAGDCPFGIRHGCGWPARLARRPRMLTATLVATCLLATDADSTELLSGIRGWRTQDEAGLLQELTELVAIPNIASDTVNIRRNAEHLLRLLEKHGFAPKLLESTGGPPAVYAERKVPGAQRT